MRFPWKYVALAAASYSCVYFVCRKWTSRDQSPEFSNRIVTLAHGLSSTALSAYCCLKEGPYPFTTIDVPLTPIQTAVLSGSLGYFIFDVWWCLHHGPRTSNTEGCLMLTHHIVSIATLTRVLQVGLNGTEYLAGLGLLEFSNPLLQTRWFLRTLGYHNQTRFYIVEWAFMMQFALVRVAYGTYIIPQMFKLQGSMREYLYFFIAMYLISGLFFLGMIQFVWRKYIIPRIRQNETSRSADSRDSIGPIE